ncbi:DUF2065 domain-containing protein [Algirhabdus cladophorae]|uniref:DUF2065 domain-containing protein n=1 Tax=Algirhabdus cladophorae TaxID=3377108 RepID=UPI003B845A24
MGIVLLAIGLVLVLEGLVFALAPSRLEDLLETFRKIPVETRRYMGLGAVGLGVVLIWAAKSLGF